jgi:hypothetical protein
MPNGGVSENMYAIVVYPRPAGSFVCMSARKRSGPNLSAVALPWMALPPTIAARLFTGANVDVVYDFTHVPSRGLPVSTTCGEMEYTKCVPRPTVNGIQFFSARSLFPHATRTPAGRDDDPEGAEDEVPDKADETSISGSPIARYICTDAALVPSHLDAPPEIKSTGGKLEKSIAHGLLAVSPASPSH